LIELEKKWSGKIRLRGRRKGSQMNLSPERRWLPNRHHARAPPAHGPGVAPNLLCLAGSEGIDASAPWQTKTWCVRLPRRCWRLGIAGDAHGSGLSFSFSWWKDCSVRSVKSQE
jgi:hypothetical protein